MHEIETWAPGSDACALCVINISSHETGSPAGRGGGGGPGPHGPPPGSATGDINNPAEGTERTKYKLNQSTDTCGMPLLRNTPNGMRYIQPTSEALFRVSGIEV